MRLGQMDRLMEVHKYVPPANSKQKATYAYQLSEWMGKKMQRADEPYLSDDKQRTEAVVARFTAYPIDGLEILDRLKDEEGRFWDVKAITEIGYGQGVEIDARLIV